MRKIWNFKLVGFAFLIGLAGVYAFNCTPLAQFTTKTYIAGEKIKNNARAYECKAYPYTGWCGQNGYQPGTSLYWNQAWIDLGPCDANTSSSVITSSSSLASSSSVIVSSSVAASSSSVIVSSSSVIISSSLIASSSSVQLSSSQILSSSSQTTNQLNTWIKNNAPTSGTQTVILPTGTYTNPPIKINSGVQVRYTR